MAGTRATGPPTRLQREADERLREQGSTLEEFLSTHRARGWSYEEIAQRIYALTSVHVSYQTIKRWLADLEAA